MRITTRGRYALSAVINLAYLDDDDDPVTIGSIARREGFSSDFLEQVFFMLRRGGLVVSIRGPGGGFRLARPAAEISLREILSAVGEDADFTGPPSQTPPPGFGRQKAGEALLELETELRRIASGMSLADIAGVRMDA